MRVAVLNTMDDYGGAATAAHGIHKAVSKEGVDSVMYVRRKTLSDPRIIQASWLPSEFTQLDSFTALRSLLKVLLSQPKGFSTLCRMAFEYIVMRGFRIYLFLRHKKQFENVVASMAYVSSFVPEYLDLQKPEIVHLHWINMSFLSVEDLLRFRDVPVVWTIHDLWPFLGVEHHSLEGYVRRYFETSSRNPYRGMPFDVSLFVWKKKMRIYPQLKKLHVVTPSLWLKRLAEKSLLFQNREISVIPNPVPTDVFYPRHKSDLRIDKKWPLHKKYIGYSTAYRHKFKGCEYFFEALRKLHSKGRAHEFFIVFNSGGSDLPGDIASCFEHHVYTQGVPHALMPELYAVLDVFVFPSTRENFPFAVIESMSSGVPVVGFPVGGVPEQIAHKTDGYLTQTYSSDELVEGIQWVLEDERRYQLLSVAARTKVEEKYSAGQIAKQYVSLYKNLV